MKIGIDARSVGTKICGVSRVAFSQIYALANLDHINEYIIFTDDIYSFPNLPENFKVVMTRCSRMNALHDLRFSKYLQKNNLDVLHVMHSWLPFVVPHGIKKIVTIHDIFTVTDPEFFHKRRPFHWVYRAYFTLLTWLTVMRADVLVTISNYCADEIRRIFTVTNKRICIVHNSPGIKPNNTFKALGSIVGREYLFFLGNFRSYKNVPTLVKGYALFLSKNESNVDLVIAGNDDTSEVLKLAKDLNVDGRIHFYHRPTDDVIDNLYRNSRAFVFPSLYEGFGIPPIEAMSYGIPVLISNAAALVEISGDAALVFDRTSPEDLADKIEIILENSSLREILVQRGHECVRRYTWENSAKQLKSVYETLQGDHL